MYKYILTTLFCISAMLFCFVSDGQTQLPTGVPNSSSATSWEKMGYLQVDKGVLFTERDTFVSRFPALIKHTNHKFYFTNGNGAKWTELGSGSGGSSIWGGITGTLSNQSDLQAALDAKASSSHTHTFSSLTSKPTTLSGFGIIPNLNDYIAFYQTTTKAQLDSILWRNLLNAKQPTITVTTIGTGAASFSNSILNIPTGQIPITVTTSGTGAATFNGTVLNVPTPDLGSKVDTSKVIVLQSLAGIKLSWKYSAGHLSDTAVISLVDSFPKLNISDTAAIHNQLVQQATAITGNSTNIVANTNAIALKVNIADFIVGETPTGTINGTNTVFTLANIPVVGKEIVYLNGIRQKRGTDYTISGATITMTNIPSTGDELISDYLKQ